MHMLEGVFSYIVAQTNHCKDVMSISAMRGFMTARGVPDCPRSSRYILKDYVNVSLKNKRYLGH